MIVGNLFTFQRLDVVVGTPDVVTVITEIDVILVDAVSVILVGPDGRKVPVINHHKVALVTGLRSLFLHGVHQDDW